MCIRDRPIVLHLLFLDHEVLLSKGDGHVILIENSDFSSNSSKAKMCIRDRDELHSYAPSKDVVSGPFVGMPEKEFTKEEIAIVVKQYGAAALRCKKAGIDIIEIHACLLYTSRCV